MLYSGRFRTPGVILVRIPWGQVWAAVAGATAAVILLTAGLAWYHQAGVEAPLVKAVAGVPGLARDTLTPGTSDGLTIWLRPGANVASVYPQVEAAAERATGQAVPLLVADNPTSSEVALLTNLQFVIATGEATGQYVAMQRAVETDAAAAGLSADVELGAAHLYLTVTNASGHRLVHVFKLPKGGTGGD